MVSAASAGQVVSANVYDVWWVHGGANRICLAMSAAGGGGGGWSSDAGGSNVVRGAGYSQLDRTTRSYTTNKNSITNCFNAANNYGPVSANQGTYLGTVYASANGQISYVFGGLSAGGTAGLFGVWNMYNRVNVMTTVADNTNPSWTYAVSNTWRAANGSATARVSIVRGLDEDGISAVYNAMGTAGATTNAAAGVGLDSTTLYTQTTGIIQNTALISSVTASYAGTPGLGFHFVSALEFNNSTTASTWYGTAGTSYVQTGFTVAFKG
jgi:hypothetical protein